MQTSALLAFPSEAENSAGKKRRTESHHLPRRTRLGCISFSVRRNDMSTKIHEDHAFHGYTRD